MKEKRINLEPWFNQHAVKDARRIYLSARDTGSYFVRSYEDLRREYAERNWSFLIKDDLPGVVNGDYIECFKDLFSIKESTKIELSWLLTSTWQQPFNPESICHVPQVHLRTLQQASTHSRGQQTAQKMLQKYNEQVVNKVSHSSGAIVNYGCGLNVVYFLTYTRKGDGDYDTATKHILSFKDGTTKTVQTVAELINRDLKGPLIFCAVPTSTKGKEPKGSNMCLDMLKGMGRETLINGLVRTITIPGRKWRPDRNKTREEDFLEELNTTAVPVQAKSQIIGKRVVIIDDVTTTGVTMRSAAVKFWEAGANSVTGLCVGKTA
jgi:hypothetical protein